MSMATSDADPDVRVSEAFGVAAIAVLGAAMIVFTLIGHPVLAIALVVPQIGALALVRTSRIAPFVFVGSVIATAVVLVATSVTTLA